MPELNIDLKELSADTDLKKKIADFHSSIDDLGVLLESMCSQDNYEKMTAEDKVRYDLFLAFAINSLYWFYLRTQGIEPSQHELKSELTRIREYMSRSTLLHQRRTEMPRIDKDAAKRFIRNGLWEPKNQNEVTAVPAEKTSNKRKREDDDIDEDDR